MGHARAVTLLSFLVSAASPWRVAAQCPDGSPPPCSRAGARAPAPNSVAVLYLDNLSPDTADAYLADGLTEEIIIRLSQVRRLEVKSRFESLRFRGHAAAQDPPTIGRAINAAYLVTGSVQRAGDRVRLRVALVRAATRAQLWGDVIDRASGDLLSVESDIATAVTTAITGQLLPAERARLTRPLTSDPIAYEAYLHGLQLAGSSFDEVAQRAAIGEFDRAVGRDPGFAAAYAATSVAWMALADGFLPPRGGYGRAREAARRAMALDSSQALASAVLSAVALALDLDAHEAERLARRALALNERSATAHVTLSGALLAEGRVDESVDEARQGWQADSLESYNDFWYFSTLLYQRQLDTAAALLERLSSILPSADLRAMTGWLRAEQGELRRALPLLNWRYYGGQYAGTYVRALVAQGDSAAARATVDSMLAARTPGYYNPLALARAYAALGDTDRGMAWLQRAVDERTIWVGVIRVDDQLALLRVDPRYAALERQLRY